MGSDGGPGTVTVTTQDGCQWTAASGVGWVSIVAGASGAGSGSVGFVVAANQAEAPRSGTLAIAGLTFTVNEAGRAPCTFDVTPQQQTFPASGGTGTIAVAAPSDCGWTATATAAWVTIVSGSTGAGNGTVTFSVAANGATSTRNGGLTVASVQITIDQAAAEPQPPPPPTECLYSVAAVDIRMHWHHTGGEVALSTAAGCTWTVASDTQWLGLVSASQGSGSETIRFSMNTYTEENSRAAALQVRWPTPTAGQNVWVTQEGCRYAVSVETQTFTADGGNGTVYVYGDPISTTCTIGCPWTARSQASWIRIVTPMPNAGDDRFTYQVDPNPGSQERVGQVLVEHRIVTIRQAGR
jgi:hypothetical protein